MGSVFAWLLESSLLVLMIITIRRIFTGKVSYAGIYALWLVVLLRFMIPVNFISTPFSVSNLCSGLFSAWEEKTVFSREAGSQTGETAWKDGMETDAAGNGRKALQNKKIQQSETIWKGSRSAQAAGRKEASDRKAGVSARTSRTMVWRCVWIAGSLLLFAWLAWSNIWMLWSMKRKRVRYGKRGKIDIYAVGGINTPCLYGFFRPAIYLPEALVLTGEKISAQELEQMITHEYVHYMHRDHIWSMLRMLLVSVYWFDPFIWLASVCSKKDAELFCDETVVRLLGEENRFSYGEMLVRLAGETGWGDFRFSMMPMSKKGREMERRIFAISERRIYSKWALVPLVAVLFVAVSITCSAGLATLAAPGKQIEAAGKTSKGMAGGAASSGAAVGTARTSSGAAVGKAAPEGEDLSMDAGRMAGSGDPVESSTYQEAFYNYIAVFTDAVNTGNTDRMYQVLDVGSDVYAQQCSLVKNYFKRGIREKVKSCSIFSEQSEGSAQGKVQIDSRERIKVFYEDGSSRMVKQRYRYTCEQTGDAWIITGMEEID